MAEKETEKTENQFKSEEEMTPEEKQQLEADEKLILETTDDDLTDPDKVEALTKAIKNAQTTIHQKRHYRDKVKELTDKLPPAEGSKKDEKKDEKKNDKKDEKKDGTIDRTTKLEFGQDHPEFSKDLRNEILEYAGALGIAPEKALEKSVVKQMIAAAERKEDVDEASSAPSKKGAPAPAKKDWANASEAEIIAQRNKNLGQG